MGAAGAGRAFAGKKGGVGEREKGGWGTMAPVFKTEK